MTKKDQKKEQRIMRCDAVAGNFQTEKGVICAKAYTFGKSSDR
ncbi:MAG: hypothetical protein H6R25_719 [Proteobacteria bacterium]|nr:hypothetical protein [Pseudomonadota bacterium]